VTPLRREILVRNQDIPQTFEEAELYQQLFLMAVQRLCIATNERDIGPALTEVRDRLSNMGFTRLLFGAEVERRMRELPPSIVISESLYRDIMAGGKDDKKDVG
jgi:hypothetical protein